VPAAGQLGAAPGQRRVKKARLRGDERTAGRDETDDNDPSGDAESERAPVRAERDPTSDRLQVPVEARLDSDNSPGPPPARTSPQDRG